MSGFIETPDDRYWEREYDDVSRAYDEVVTERDSLRAELDRLRGVVQAVEAREADLRDWLRRYRVALCLNFEPHDAHPFDAPAGRFLCRGVAALAAAADVPQPEAQR